MLIIGLVIGLTIGFFKIGPDIEFKTAFLVLGFMAAIFLIACKIYKKSLKNLPSEKGIILGKHAFILNDEGFKEETEQSSSTLKWTGVQGVEETADMIFIFIDKVSAHFIPKHFFANEKEANNFKMAIIEKCKHL